MQDRVVPTPSRTPRGGPPSGHTSGTPVTPAATDTEQRPFFPRRSVSSSAPHRNSRCSYSPRPRQRHRRPLRYSPWTSAAFTWPPRFLYPRERAGRHSRSRLRHHREPRRSEASQRPRPPHVERQPSVADSLSAHNAPPVTHACHTSCLGRMSAKPPRGVRSRWSLTSTLPSVAPIGRAPLVGESDVIGDSDAAPLPETAAEPCGSALECPRSSATLHRVCTGPSSHNNFVMRRWAFPAHTRMASSPQSPAPAVATLCGPPATLRAETKGAFASSAAVPGNGAHWRESSVIERSGNAPPLPRLPPVAPQRKAGLPSQPRHSRSSRRARHRRPASHDLKKGSPHATRPCSPLPRFMPAATTCVLGIKRVIHPTPQSCHDDCVAPVTPAPCAIFIPASE